VETVGRAEAQLNAKKAAQEPCLSVIRELVRTYQAFVTYDEAHIRKLDLTSPQFDVIATLGNTPGMTMGQLAEKTLVTKGTLTGIIDRLEKKGLVRREVPPENRRCFKIVLTHDGEQVFEEVFPAHIAYMKERFDLLSPEELEQTKVVLNRIREIFDSEPKPEEEC
jgi:MarR family transcriptional regulator, 2-MHQ and catechol-resistance regulon repressor